MAASSCFYQRTTLGMLWKQWGSLLHYIYLKKLNGAIYMHAQAQHQSITFAGLTIPHFDAYHIWCIPSIGYSFWERYIWMHSISFCLSISWRLLISLAQVALDVFFHCHCSRILCILSFNIGHDSSFSTSEMTSLLMRRQAPTEAKEFSSCAIIWLMWSKSKSWHCNSANLLHASSLNMGGRSSSSTMTDWLHHGGTLEEMLARILSQLHAVTFHSRTCHAHSCHACWLHWHARSQTNPSCMGAPIQEGSGNQTSCISDRETDTVHLHGARGNSYGWGWGS